MFSPDSGLGKKQRHKHKTRALNLQTRMDIIAHHRGPHLDHQHYVNLQDGTTAPTLSPPAKKSLPPPILTTFYRGTIESVLTRCINVWYGNCSAADRKTLQRTVNTIGAPLTFILDIFFSLHDAPATPIVSWRTPPILPVSSSSYHQEDGTRASEPAPPDCSTAFSPGCESPELKITPTSWNMDSPPPPPHPYHVTGKKLSNFFVQFKVCYTQVSVQTTCSNTLSSIRTRHFHTLLCVHKSHKRLSDICMFTCSCTTNHLTLFPSQLLECFSFCTCTVFARHFHSLYFFSLCIGNHFYI